METKKPVHAVACHDARCSHYNRDVMSPWQWASPVKTPFILFLVAYISKMNSRSAKFKTNFVQWIQSHLNSVIFVKVALILLYRFFLNFAKSFILAF